MRNLFKIDKFKIFLNKSLSLNFFFFINDIQIYFFTNIGKPTFPKKEFENRNYEHIDFLFFFFLNIKKKH